MKRYTFCYLHQDGLTTSVSRAFESDKAAVEFAHIGLVRHAIVEVLKDGAVVAQLHRESGNVIAARAAFQAADVVALQVTL